MSDENKKYPVGWPIKKLTKDDISFWVKCLISVIALCIIISLIPALIVGIIYLSVQILSDYIAGNEATDIRGSILLLSALLGASGIPLFIWRTAIAQSQASTAKDRAYTELFTKAIEQLGAEKPKKEEVLDENGESVKDNAGQPLMRELYVPNIEVRIGAIYALERIMHDSEKDAPAIVDTLAAYVRENCGKPSLECEIPQEGDYKNVSKWVEAIKNYIGSIYWPAGIKTLRVRATELHKLPQFNRADIRTALTVIGRRPNAVKNKDKMPDLRMTNFQGWDLSNFDLSYCSLIAAEMQGASLINANMQNAELIGTQMQGAHLSYAKMLGADLSYAQMQGADLSYAKMQGADLSYAEMQGADLSYAEMQGADLSYAQMQGADLSDVQMQGADLSYATISNAEIKSAKLTASSVIYVDFTKADIDYDELQTQTKIMFGHKTHTMLPEGMEPPKHWPMAIIVYDAELEQYQNEWQAFKKKMGVE